MKAEDGQELSHNYRSIQPLNHRALVYVADEHSEHHSSENSAPSLKTKSSFWIVLAIAKIFFLTH